MSTETLRKHLYSYSKPPGHGLSDGPGALGCGMCRGPARKTIRGLSPLVAHRFRSVSPRRAMQPSTAGARPLSTVSNQSHVLHTPCGAWAG